MGKLRAEYEDAFRNWAETVDGLHVAREGSVTGAALSLAESEEADAQILYRKSRDRLVEQLLNPGVKNTK